jgi:hypothetical protein
MSETWKGVPPPHLPDRKPLTPEQEARIREIVRQEMAASESALADQGGREQ